MLSRDFPPLLADLMGPLAREVLLIAYLDTQGHALGHVFLGGEDVNAVHGRYRPLIAPALRLGAAGFLLAHNHPSGDPRPSAADIRATHGLQALGRALELEFADHLVVGGRQVTSMRACGLLGGRIERRRCAA